MKIVDSLKMLAGSITIYAVVATAYACGDANQPAKLGHTATVASGGSDGGASGASAAGGENTTSESVGAGPVPPAMADPVPGTRLRSRYRVSSDGSREWIGWTDTELGAPCSWLVLNDGATRCVPLPAFGWSGLFADSACTIRVSRRAFCNVDNEYSYYAVSDGCASNWEIYESLPLQTGTQLYQQQGSECRMYSSGDAGLSTEDDRVMGDAVPPSRFVSSEIVDGP